MFETYGPHKKKLKTYESSEKVTDFIINIIGHWLNECKVPATVTSQLSAKQHLT